MSKLLSNFGKQGVNLGLSTMKVDIDDTTHLSKYFNLVEFNPLLTAGKNPISFNGSSLLATGSEIKIECLDSSGQSLFVESPQSNIQYTDVAKFIISIHVYDEIYNGPGKLILVGKTTKGEIVRWIGNISIDKTQKNSSRVRFYNKPSLEVQGLLYPIVTNDAGSSLTKTISFDGLCYGYSVIPKKDTNKNRVDLRRTDIDYRLALIPSIDNVITPSENQTASFNSQMEGQIINIKTTSIREPLSYSNKNIEVSASFKVKKVIDSSTIQLSEPFFYTVGKDQYITDIDQAEFNSTYTWISYNTQSDAYLSYTPTGGSKVYMKQSYVDVLYKNLKTFSGFIARHKLYRKSLIYPGDYQLIVDEPLGALELLTDTITANQSYASIGEFYNQFHINKYYYTSSNMIQLSHSVSPYINAMRIEKTTDQFSLVNDNTYVIVKADSANTTNDSNYTPYSSEAFIEMSGSSYNSNFITLKKGALYVLSTNLIIEKDIGDTTANVSFYITSSIPEITTEKTYSSRFGMKIGSIGTSEQTSTKRFAEKQMLYFTPSNDYYGTLVIVPHNCNVTLSELSLKVYGDYGFSPDILFTRIPFKINVAKETFQLKAELFDINSTLVYSDLNTISTFDPNGESLFTYIGNSNLNPSLNTFLSGSLTISQSLYLPNIPNCPTNGIRLLGYHTPTFPHTPSDGQVCYTNITDVSASTDYIKVSSVSGLVATDAYSIAIGSIRNISR